MKISFTLNQMYHVRSNDFRLHTALNLFRSYNGHAVGDFYDANDARNEIAAGSYTIQSNEVGRFISIRGNEIYLDDFFHAAKVGDAFVELQRRENAIADGSGNLAQWYKAVKHLKTLLDATEW